MSALVLTRRRSASARQLVVRGALHSGPGLLGGLLVAIVVAIAVLGPVFSPHLRGASSAPPTCRPGKATAARHRRARPRRAEPLPSRRPHAAVPSRSPPRCSAYLIGIAARPRLGIRSRTSRSCRGLGRRCAPRLPPHRARPHAGRSRRVEHDRRRAGIAAVHAPRVYRIARSATLDIATQEYVEAAVARGERFGAILRREILPNIWPPSSPTSASALPAPSSSTRHSATSASGRRPRRPTGRSMISDDRLGLTIQPWVVVVPAVTHRMFSRSASIWSRTRRTCLGPVGASSRWLSRRRRCRFPACASRQTGALRSSMTSASSRARRGARAGRRVGLGQDHHGARSDGPRAPGRAHRGRRATLGATSVLSSSDALLRDIRGRADRLRPAGPGGRASTRGSGSGIRSRR